MKTQLRKQSHGFTIIEVMIVLAIAGLILAIVFLAVPALQRSQRNNGRTNDAARTGTAVNNWVSNNNGAIFTAGTGNANLTSVITDLGNLSQYVLTAGTTFTVALGSSNPAPITNLTDIRVVTGAKCGSAGAVTTTNASARTMALQYAIEGGGGNTSVCLDI